MATEYFTTVASSGAYTALGTNDEELVLVHAYRGERLPAEFGAEFPALRLFLAVCQSSDLVYHWRDQLLGRPAAGSIWRQLTTVHQVNYILQSHVALASCQAGTDYSELSPGNQPEDTPLPDRLEACGLFVHDKLQMAFCQQILAAIADFPRVAGFLVHPIVGTPTERWLRPESP